MIVKYIKILLFSLAFFSVSFFRSQILSVDKLDRITEERENEGNIKSAITINIEALKSYRKDYNAKGAVNALIHIGNLLTTLGDYQRSIKYLDQANKRIVEIQDPLLESKLNNEYGRTYSLLGLHKQANKKLNKAIEISASIDVKNHRNVQLYNSYTWKWYNFEALQETDSVCSMQQKCLDLSPTPLVYVKIANTYINQKKHLDSVEFYLKKAQASTDIKYNNEKQQAFLSYGKLYTLKNNPTEALHYYKKYLEYSKKIRNAGYVRDAYKEISDSYKALHNWQQADKNLHLYFILSDSISKSEKKMLHDITEKLIAQKEYEDDKEKSNLYLLLGGVIIIIIFLLFILYIYRKNKKTYQKTNLETQELNKRINASFDEIIQLAKSGDPFFLTRFKEVYSEFYRKLISISPNLTDQDTRFCAFIRLDLSHKEIAKYENITLKSVETKKYRIKKKLSLSKNTDFNRWIKDL